jgi:ribonuclease HII
MIGIDEVGRGAWAGPLLVVAVRATGALPAGLTDSKKLNMQQRTELAKRIIESCEIGEGWVEPSEIDELGLTGAMRRAVSRALIAVHASFEEPIILDGNVNYCADDYLNVETIIKADNSVPIVSAASIYAKVMRDKHMARAAQFYPFYGFEHHVGYGTELHRSLLKIHGACKLHRKSYKPVAAHL